MQHGLVVYVVLFLALLGGAIGLPIPEDIPLLVGGIFLQQEAATALPIFLVCYSAVVLGDLFIFFIGRKFGVSLFEKPWFKSRISPSRIRKVKLNLEKRSLLMIFLARHLFYLRTVTFLACGAVRMRIRRFIIADLIAALVSVPLMIAIGFFASEHIEGFLTASRKFQRIISVVFIGLVVSAYVIYRYRKRRVVNESARAQSAEDLEVKVP